MASPIRKILITQDYDPSRHRPYLDLAKEFNLEFVFKSLIQVVPIDKDEFAKHVVDVNTSTAILLTSRNAIRIFFQLCRQLDVQGLTQKKYFTMGVESATLLMQQAAVPSRNIFSSAASSKELISVIQQHKRDIFLFPCSAIRGSEIPEFFRAHRMRYTELTTYYTHPLPVTDFSPDQFDMIAFFSPSGVHSFVQQFPDFEQAKKRIAAVGPTTCQALMRAGLRVQIQPEKPTADEMRKAMKRFLNSEILY